MTLTGKTRFRTDWRGRLILQVQVKWFEFWGYHYDWRDAKLKDLKPKTLQVIEDSVEVD